ncbi:nitroreductase family protein [Acanthopleuribacter pedis]|uniref:Nitroreductase family protein n=1 Tax=Acanthopleuribacter pedis TaxID=442870 RepID=A0A8J7QMK6_9BACT|nr:nitroreductase family protein [Acanthopleuribacter pedis]MBO1322175.1 nitroreductase family protein [Acanthopleuribacter pedis]
MEKPAPGNAPIHSLIQYRWSPRAFKPQSMSPEQVRTLLEAARWAASAFNEQPWCFLVARRDQPEAFAALLACLVPANQKWAQNAGLLILSFAHTTFTRNGKPNIHAFHDVGLAAGQLALQATALGLQAHMMAGIDREHIAATYTLPADHEAVAGIAVGVPDDPGSLEEPLAERERAPRERNALETFCFQDEFGKGLAF